MAKAMLIMDMPSSCDMCDFVDDSESGKMWCGLPTFGYEVTDCIACRPSDCPLREVPQKIGYKEALKMPRNGNLADVINLYNTCIDEILGGGE